LGLDKPVKAVFHNDWEECAEKNDDGQYEIKIGGFGARRTQVRHELYHLFRHVDRGWKGNLHYLLIDEPQAIAYEVFRLKL
jgi:hypothetical protein